MNPEAAANAAKQEANQEWAAQFPFRIDTGFQNQAQTFGTPGVFTPPQPSSLGLLPDLSFGPEMLASFTPSTTSPLNRFQLPSTRLTQPNKWSTNIYG